MTQNRRKLDIQETTAPLVQVRHDAGSYAFVSPRRSRKLPAVIVDAPPELEFDDVPTRDIRPLLARGTPVYGTPVAAVEPLLEETVPEDKRPTVELVAAEPRPEPYRDPELCSCERMIDALRSKVVMVVVAGPVTLSPAVLREKELLEGDFDLSRFERAYDGKLWAFRHCPFEGCLIDDQVAILDQVSNMTCCGTMDLAVAHGRVELPEPDRCDRPSARFTDAGRSAVFFSYCPWCATGIVDLVIARHKRHRGL